jgi:hypothetical protein
MKPADSRAAARVGPLSGSQLRALFLVASDAGLASEVERLLDTATAETTPVEDLMRLKERAQARIGAAGRQAAGALRTSGRLVGRPSAWPVVS